MAERPLTLSLDPATLARAMAAAADAGLSVEAWAAEVLSAALTSSVRESTASFEGPHDWTEANRRLAEYDRTGEFIPLEEALQSFDQALEAALARKR